MRSYTPHESLQQHGSSSRRIWLDRPSEQWLGSGCSAYRSSCAIMTDSLTTVLSVAAFIDFIVDRNIDRADSIIWRAN
jgi:hypothetical protein